jgi:hypothetical protein
MLRNASLNIKSPADILAGLSIVIQQKRLTVHSFFQGLTGFEFWNV